MESDMQRYLRAIIPPLTHASHKGTAGRIGVVGGSLEWVPLGTLPLGHVHDQDYLWLHAFQVYWCTLLRRHICNESCELKQVEELHQVIDSIATWLYYLWPSQVILLVSFPDHIHGNEIQIHSPKCFYILFAGSWLGSCVLSGGCSHCDQIL